MYDVQAVLKRDHCSALDKYKMKGSGTTRWKAAVGVSALPLRLWRCHKLCASVVAAVASLLCCGWLAGGTVPRWPASSRVPAYECAKSPGVVYFPTPPAVGLLQEVLREQGGIFEQAGRTPTGKIIWQLKAAAEQAAGRQL